MNVKRMQIYGFLLKMNAYSHEKYIFPSFFLAIWNYLLTFAPDILLITHE